LAFLVNLSIFLIIGNTSPLTYNVLGHAKLCVILFSGYTLFGEQCTILNLSGVLLALGGVVSYTHLSLL
jgi:solute carrier family 35 protein E3